MDSEKKVLYAMQAIILFIAFGYLIAVTFFDMLETGVDHSKTIVGFLLGTVVGTIIAYNWGSSKGSADKTAAAKNRMQSKRRIKKEEAMKKLYLFVLAAIIALSPMAVANPVWATVTVETSRAAYTCDGVLTTYAYPFKVLADADLLVVKKATATSAETTLVLNTDYTVTGAGTSGGNVVLTAASKCGAGYTLTILRDMAATQTTDYVDGEAFSAVSIEDALDKVTLVQQQQAEQISRAPKLPKTSSITDISLPNPAADNYIGWNAGATGLENKSGPVVTTATQYEIDALVSYGGGTATTQATIEAALTAIGTVNKVTLLLRPGTWVISSNADWSAYTNVTFKIVPGAVISHGTFTMNIPNIDAGLYQWLTGVGAVTFLGSTKIAYPQWFLTNTIPGTTIMTAAFQYAAASVIAASGTVKVPMGIYKLDGTVVCQNNSVAAVRWEFDNGVELDTYLTGTTPLFSYTGVADVNMQAGIYGYPSIIAKNAGPVTARNSGVAVLAQGVVGIRFEFLAKDMTYALHLYNNEVNSYTEQVKFDIYSEYCQEAIRFEKNAGDSSFHGCGGILYANVYAGQTAINVGSGCYWYNFDLHLDAISHSVAPSAKAILIQSDGTTAHGTATFYIENQDEGAGGTAQAFDMPGAQPWSAQTFVTSQGVPLTGVRAKRLGLNFEDAGGPGSTLSAFASGQRSYNLASDGTVDLVHADGAAIVIRDGTSGGTAFLIADGATGVTVISDPGNKVQKVDLNATITTPYTASTIGFVGGGHIPCTITDSANNFLGSGIVSGMKLTISGSANNNVVVTVKTAAAGILTLETTDVLTTEGAGAPITLTYTPAFFIDPTVSTATITRITNRFATAKIIDTLTLGF